MLLFFMVVSTTRAYFSNRCIDSLLNIKTSPDIGQCRYLQNLHQLLYILLTLISFLQVVLHLIERCLKYLLQWLFLCYYWVHVSLLNADCVNLTDWYLNSLNVEWIIVLLLKVQNYQLPYFHLAIHNLFACTICFFSIKVDLVSSHTRRNNI